MLDVRMILTLLVTGIQSLLCPWGRWSLSRLSFFELSGDRSFVKNVSIFITRFAAIWPLNRPC